MASVQTCLYSSLYKSNNQIYPYTLPPCACRTVARAVYFNLPSAAFLLEKGEEKKKIGGSRIGGEPPIENNYFLRCFKKSSIPTISTFGKGMFSNSLKCLSSVTIKIALLAMAQSTNLLSSSSAFINPKL